MRIDFIIKPDFLEYEELIKEQFLNSGYTILQEKEKHLTKEEAEDLYERLKLTHPWYNDIAEYMCSGVSKIFIMEKEAENFNELFRDCLRIKFEIRDILKIKPMNDDMTVNVKTGLHTPDSEEEFARDVRIFEIEL